MDNTMNNNKVSDNPIYSLASRINYHLVSNHFDGEVYINVTDGKPHLEMEIYSGDWKHDHLRATMLVGDYLSDHGVSFHHSEIPNPDDYGSDTYDARHIWYLM